MSSADEKVLFPVGKEREHSVSLLFKFFQYNLLHGKWEGAKACIRQLNEEGHIIDVDIKQVLKQIVFHPYEKCVFTGEVPSPHHLSWLSLQEYRKLLPLEEIIIKMEATALLLFRDSIFSELNPNKSGFALEEILEKLVKEGEFHLLLFETSQDITENIVKELCEYQCIISQLREKQGFQTAQNIILSSDLTLHLQKTLKDDPILGNALILFLLAPPLVTELRKNNEILHGVFLQAVQSILNKIVSKDVQNISEYQHKLYHVLSLYNPEPYQNYELLRDLLSRLFELSYTRTAPVNLMKVLSAFVGRSHHYLVEEYCAYEYETETKRTALSHDLQSGNFNEDQQRLLHISGETNHSQQFHHFFLMCLKKKQHLLSAVVEAALNLIKHQMFSDLKKLLSVPELNPLRPLILLVGWTVCQNVSDARLLLQTLWDEQWCCLHPDIESGCHKLAYQIDLIQWCLEKTKPLLSTSDSNAVTHQQRAAAMFHCLENHSVLFVLHQSTRLGRLDQGQVLNLLRKSPQSEEEQKPKSVRFAEDDCIGESMPSIHIEQHRDISIFSGYCAIQQVMDAIYFCAENNNELLMNPVQRKYHYSAKNAFSTNKNKVSNSYMCNNWEGKSDNDFPDSYNKNVTEKLSKAKDFISRLQPLSYRVEVLENIFSLLFVTHENIQETVYDIESDSGEVDEEGKIKSEAVSTDSSLRITEGSMSPTSPLIVTESIIKQIEKLNALSYDEPFPDPPPQQQRSSKRSFIDGARKEAASDSVSKVKVEDKTYKPSGNCSTVSGESISNYLRFGLLCNEYLIRDILAMVKDCMLDLSAARFQVKGQGSGNSGVRPAGKEAKSFIDVKLEGQLSVLVVSSVSQENLSKRVSQLSQYVNEAYWRFQLVCHKDIPRTPGVVLSKPIVVYVDEEETSINLLAAEDSVTVAPKSSFSLSSGSNSRSSPNADSETPTNGNKDAHRKKRSRSRSRQRRSMSQTSSKQKGIISYMLSSPETLLCMCIKRNSLMQAAEVIKLLKLEDRPEAKEVKFAEVYNKCARKLQSLLMANKSNPSQTNQPGKMTLKGLGSVAAAGVATVSVSSLTEDLLKGADLPKLPLTRSQLMSSNDLDNIPSMVTFDLLCTSCRTWEMCNNMIDIVKTYISTNPKTSSISDENQVDDIKSKQEGKVKSIKDCLAIFDSLLQLGSDSNAGNIATNFKEIYCLLYKHSISTFLQTAILPLSHSECLAYANLIIEMKRAMEKVDHTFQVHGKMPLEGYSDRSPPRTSPYTSPKSSPRKEDHAANQPVLHNVMKQLIVIMRRDVPHGGIYRFLCRRNGQTIAVNRDYLQSLYDHLKQLAFVVMETEKKSKDAMVFPKNYFRMLDEGPIRILGRLMFSLKMFPAKLEAVAKSLSLNLTHIIVHSCCTRIPSKHPTWALKHSAEDLSVGRKRELLQSQCSLDNINGNPEEVVRHILTKLLYVMKDIANKNNAKSVFDISCAKLALKLTKVHEIFSLTDFLEDINLDLLNTREEKLCFYANLQNLMFLHMWLDLIRNSMLITEVDDDSGDHCQVSKLYTEMTLSEQVIHLNKFFYKVGQLGKISLFDLKYTLNRAGLPPPSEFECILSSRLIELSQHDNWSKYALAPEPRLLFVLTSCAESSPPIQVLLPELVKAQLQKAMKEYLNHTVVINKDKNTVTIPELLMWYKNDFSCDSDDLCARNEGIMHVIQNNTSGEAHDAITEMLQLDVIHGFAESIDVEGRKELPFKVGIESYKPEFIISFGYEAEEPKMVARKGHRRVTSLPKNIHLSFSNSGSLEEKESLYQLTPTTLEYVKSECPLVATLVSLVCTDELDEIEEHLTDDYFSESLRSRSSSEMSLVDIRSYRYQKLTDDYPILKRHILNYVIPIAGAEHPDILKSGDPLLKFITSNISEKVKACMLNLHDSAQFQDVLRKMIDDLMSHSKWIQVIDVLDSLPRHVFQQNSDLCELQDFVIVCFINEKIKNQRCLQKSDADEIEKYWRRFISIDRKFHTLLAVFECLPLEHNLRLFEMFCFDPLSEENLVIVKQKLKEMNMFNMITACAKTLQVKMSAKRESFVGEESKGEYLTVLDKFMDWRNLLSQEVVSPDEVLAVLLRMGDYYTASIWCKHVKFPRPKYLDVVEHQLITLLEENQSANATKAYLVMEEISDSNGKECYHVCKKLLDKLTNQNNVLFILNYMLDRLGSVLKTETEDKLCLMRIGSRMLLCLPKSLHSEYSHLIKSPKIILEQLLMNMKIELAGKCFHAVQTELSTFRNVEQRFTLQDFNKLLTTYAKKALDLSGIVMETEVKDRSQSEASSASSEKTAGSGTPELVRSPTKRLNLVEAVRAKASVDFGGNKPLSPASSPNTISGSLRSETGATKFIMPSEPPPKEKWQPDSATMTCMVCKVERFSMFNRRHHCRRCGRVVCSTCSTKKSMILGVLARTCDDCYSQIYNSSKTETDVYKSLASSNNVSGSSLSFCTFSPSPRVNALTREGPKEYLGNDPHSQQQWQLMPYSGDHNEMTREDFYYEQAPSTSLCLSILELHSHPTVCGQLMLNLCDDLSRYLKPLAPGVPNPEVDYSLILSMMRTLMFHAKMRFSVSGESQGLAQCEVYQSYIDLLSLLTDDNYPDLPSLQDLTKKDSVMRLRDKLIQDERLQLAVEVSTKCGLDTSGVWGAWGMNCLMAGDYQGAREKYSRCLKVPQDRNVVLPMSKYLRDIMDYLEIMPAAGPSQLHLLMTKSLSWQDLLTTHVSVSDDSPSDSLQFQECLFYLKTYGTHSHVIDFNRRNGRWMKAVQFILDKKCCTEVFMESLLIPALARGELGKLTDQMVMIDPTLEKWHPYLTATCRYLLKHKYHNTLYDFQIFMKDFIRAAMTCITCFYQKGAQSYLDLNYKINHLHDAILHMQAFSDPKQWGSVRSSHLTVQSGEGFKKSEGAVRLIMTREEIDKYMRSMSLQIEVTKYLASCLTHTEGDATAVAMQYVGGTRSTHLPTLFGQAKVKTDLVTMILLSGNNIAAGFDLAYKIITEYKLGAATIFTHVAREMAKHQRYPHVRQLLDCVNSVGLGSDETVDEIVGACILVIADKPNEVKEAENLIKLLRKDSNKINAYILCGKLRSAYLMAVKAERVEDVQRIAGAAQRMGQSAVKTICNKWLEQRKK